MSEESDIYQGVDRGQFKVIRLMDKSGVVTGVTARIKEANIYVYLTDKQYALIRYKIEWWNEGGERQLYVPRDRTSSNLFVRSVPTIGNRILYLEDAIINDFLNEKVLADPSALKDFAQESKQQREDAEIWRSLKNTGYSYRNAVHVTKFEATDTTPLTVVEEGLRYDLKASTDEGDGVSVNEGGYKFTRIRDCIDFMAQGVD